MYEYYYGLNAVLAIAGVSFLLGGFLFGWLIRNALKKHYEYERYSDRPYFISDESLKNAYDAADTQLNKILREHQEHQRTLH